MHGGAVAEAGDPAETIAFALEQPSMISFAQPGSRFGQCVEYRLQVERRATDDFEHICGSRLLLQRFTQLVEQPDIFNRDHCLTCEILDQLDLLVRVWLDRSTQQANDANRHAVAQQGHPEH